MMRCAELLVLGLLQDQRVLLDRGGDEQRIAARSLDAGQLRGEVGGLGIHGLHHADLDAIGLQHLGELIGRADAEIVVGVEEVGLLDAELGSTSGWNALASISEVGLMRKM